MTKKFFRRNSSDEWRIGTDERFFFGFLGEPRPSVATGESPDWRQSLAARLPTPVHRTRILVVLQTAVRSRGPRKTAGGSPQTAERALHAVCSRLVSAKKSAREVSEIFYKKSTSFLYGSLP